MKRRGKQADLKESLEKLVTRLDKSNDGAYQQVAASLAWENVAGETTLSHTTGAHLRGGEMVVFVDSPLWAAELTSMAEQYRKALNTEMGKDLVRSVRFTVSRKVQDRRQLNSEEMDHEHFYTQDDVESIPLTDQEMRQVVSSVSAIEDSELQEVVLRATVADLEWKKGLAARKAP